MKDRIAENPGRYKLTFEGSLGEQYAVLELDDTPSEVGTPLNAATLASDSVLDLLGLPDTATPTDVFQALINKLSDSGWLNIDVIGSNFNLYTAGSPIRYRKIGNQVLVEGCVKPNATITGSTTAYTICTLPTGFRPTRAIDTICQGSNNAIWLCRIETSGVITFSRYRSMAATESGYTNAANNVYLPFHVTFFI